MPTPFTDIYVKANALFEDANLLLTLDDEEYEALLELFLSKSRSIYFKSCTKDLSNIDHELKQFNETLDEEEQWILAEGIKLCWLERKLFDEQKLKDKLSTKDYVRHSGANLIDRLTKLVKETRTNLNNYDIKYSFKSFDGFN